MLLGRGVKYIFLAAFPVILMIAIFAPEILGLWLGAPFAQNGSLVLRWFTAGVLASCLGHLPYVLLQSAGRPDIPAKLQLVELPLYVCGLLLLVKAYGISGAAMAWAGRVALESIFLFFFAHKLLPHKPGFLPRLAIASAGGFLALCVTTLPQSLAIRIGLVLLGLLIFCLGSWRWVLAPDEREFMLQVRRDIRVKNETLTDVY
jgi:O-antigen/teichoic acid export membrane protein